MYLHLEVVKNVFIGSHVELCVNVCATNSDLCQMWAKKKKKHCASEKQPLKGTKIWKTFCFAVNVH